MIGLMMAGGLGSRMHATHEKLVLGNIPVALRVAEALESCRMVTRVVADVSPGAPQTRSMLAGRIKTLETPGAGYSADLAYALGRLAGPVLVTPADLPLLDGGILECICHMYEGGYWTTILISELYAARLGLSPGMTINMEGIRCRYTGISVVDADCMDAPARYVIMDDYRIAANMNTARDWDLLGAAQYLPKDYGL